MYCMHKLSMREQPVMNLKNAFLRSIIKCEGQIYVQQPTEKATPPMFVTDLTLKPL